MSFKANTNSLKSDHNSDNDNDSDNNNAEVTMKRYMCLLCGLIYNEAQGWPDEGIAPGTRWEDVPPNWRCPDCGACKEDFEMVEI